MSQFCCLVDHQSIVWLELKDVEQATRYIPGHRTEPSNGDKVVPSSLDL